MLGNKMLLLIKIACAAKISWIIRILSIKATLLVVALIKS